MKKVILSLFVATSIMAVSCNSTPDAHNAEASDAVSTEATTTADISMKVNTEKSIVEWLGTKPVGDSHNGTINIKSGTLQLTEDNKISGGTFVIDMNSIKGVDLKDQPEKNAKLEGHLKADDFFNVAQFPEATFEISGVAEASDADKLKFKEATHMISGNFTMKDVKKNISIPAKVTIDENGMTAISEFNIDRTQWGVNYNSDQSIKNKFINKDINLKLNLVAAK